jgi:hypothetical protein
LDFALGKVAADADADADADAAERMWQFDGVW